MKPDLLEQAMSHISDKHIIESMEPKKRHPIRWAGAVAAILALALTAGTLGLPKVFDNVVSTPEAEHPISGEDSTRAPESQDPGPSAPTEESSNLSTNLSLLANVLVSQSSPRILGNPGFENYTDSTQLQAALNAWNAQNAQRNNDTQAAVQTLRSFFQSSSSVFLQGAKGENRVWSPVNGYISLAMLAESTAGESRQQILDALGYSDMATLRAQVSAIWESAYFHDGKEISYLANSLWLDQNFRANQEALNNLGYSHYASVYQTDLGSESANSDLQAWVNHHTGGLLKEYTGGLQLPEETAMALASTIYLQSKWGQEFNKALSTDGIFATPKGDVKCTFMNKKQWQTDFYQTDTYGAVRLNLLNGANLWLFLPEEGTEAEALVRDGGYFETILNADARSNPQKRTALVNLSLPRFDVSSSADLKDGLQQLGITNIFRKETADFSALLDTDLPVWTGAVNQAARIRIDEEGAEAASYIVIENPGSCAPGQETSVIDFTLDRPFLFVMEKNDIPLFTGIVNQP